MPKECLPEHLRDARQGLLISDEQLLRWKAALTAECIDDPEDWLMWCTDVGVALIDEVIQLRKDIKMWEAEWRSQGR